MIAALPLITSALSMLAPSETAGSVAASAAKSVAGAGADFGQVMSKVSADAMHSMKAAESLAVDGIEGKANTQQVVQAVMSAQESLQTALAIRDKSVAAFQEITRMAI